MRLWRLLLATVLAGGGVLLAITAPDVRRCGAWPLWGGVLAALAALPMLAALWRRYGSECSVIPLMLITIGVLAAVMSDDTACVVTPLLNFSYVLLICFGVAVIGICAGWFFFAITVR